MRGKPKTAKNASLVTPGLVDIHFHGAFGIDLMIADSNQMDELSTRLWQAGVAAFCPTTLSSPHREMLAAVGRMGRWIQSTRKNRAHKGAIPLGIHLEGPYISGAACGAHPPATLRKVSFLELEELWEESQKTLKILTVAPEELSGTQLQELTSWCTKRGIVLSLGHSKASEAQAFQAFKAGFRGVTHAWNAMNFHHRAPGVLGAAMAHPKVYLELIIDQIHVAPKVIRWTRALHPAERICFVSDCVPAAATREGTWHPFGSLQIQFRDGAGRLSDGSLAGGGRLLPEMVGLWAENEARETGIPALQILKASQPSFFKAQLLGLGFANTALGKALEKRKIVWTQGRDGTLKAAAKP